MISKKILIFLLFCAILHAQNTFDTTPQQPKDVLYQYLDVVLSVAVPLIMVMIVIAAAVYVIGQLFGAETRARATQYASGLISAALISAGVIVLLYTLIPAMTRPTPMPMEPQLIEETIENVKNLAQNTLIMLIATMIVFASALYVIAQLFGAETRARATVWATGIMVAAIVSSIVYLLVFELLLGLKGTFFTEVGLGDYQFIVLVVITFMTAFILITYMLSKFLKVPEWEAYLNIELTNLLSSFLILLFVVALFAVGDVFGEMIVTQASQEGVIPQGADISSPPRATIWYMQQNILGSVLDALSDVYRIQICTSVLNMFYKRTGETVLSTVFKLFPGIDVFMSITNVLSFGMVSLSGSITAQILFLYLSDATMKSLVLPAGLILRFLPPTREAGTFLIALAFGLYIIFPTTYLVSGMVLKDIGMPKYDKPRVTKLVWSLCGPFKYGVATVVLGATASVLSYIPGGGAITPVVSTLLSEGVLNALSMAEFVPIMRHLATVSLVALFIPAFSIVLTIGFINAMTKFLVMKV